jgi:hypothetical protein
MRNRVYVVVENAGYEGEQDIVSFATSREAYAHIKEHYDADELDQFDKNCLHVAVRTDFEDGESEYQ